MKKTIGGFLLFVLLAIAVRPAFAATLSCPLADPPIPLGVTSDPILIAKWFTTFADQEDGWKRVLTTLFTLPTGNGSEVTVYGVRCKYLPS